MWEKTKLTTTPPDQTTNQRGAERRAIIMPARLAWKDQRGTDRFASVVTRDVSDLGIFIESPKSLSIPLYRLVHFQIEPSVRAIYELPRSLRQGRILTAVYRVLPANQDTQYGMALRLMVDPGPAAAREFASANAGSGVPGAHS